MLKTFVFFYMGLSFHVELKQYKSVQMSQFLVTMVYNPTTKYFLFYWTQFQLKLQPELLLHKLHTRQDLHQNSSFFQKNPSIMIEFLEFELFLQPTQFRPRPLLTFLHPKEPFEQVPLFFEKSPHTNLQTWLVLSLFQNQSLHVMHLFLSLPWLNY